MPRTQAIKLAVSFAGGRPTAAALGQLRSWSKVAGGMPIQELAAHLSAGLPLVLGIFAQTESSELARALGRVGFQVTTSTPVEQHGA